MLDREAWGITANIIYTACLLVVALGVIVVSFPEGAAAIIVVLALTGAFLLIFRYLTPEKTFITDIFLLALVLRLGFGIFIHLADLRDFFGGDANTYDFRGSILMDSWSGIKVNELELFIASNTSGAGWGMDYFVAAIYTALGRNIFAAQSFCGVIGAATAPMVFFCAKRIYNNVSAAKLSAILVAVFPAFIIWSSQLLKDGLIIFLLVLTMTMVLELQEKISFGAVLLLGLSIAGILSLRFYIFYMVVIAVVGSFVIGVSNTTKSLITRTVAFVMLGFALTFFGVIQVASVNFDRYGTLERVQRSRLGLTQRVESGFAADADVSTAQGALTIIPIGFTYLIFAPFPWQLGSLRQSITLPEVLVWWAMMPLLIAGLVYSVRHKLRQALPVLLFTLMLTLAYSIFQGNIGTAYRQRTQIQVFLFIFIAVGWTLRKERRADRKLQQIHERERLEAAIRARGEART